MSKRMLWPMLPGAVTDARETWVAISSFEEKATVQEIIENIREIIDRSGCSRIGVTLGVMLTFAQALEYLVEEHEMHWEERGAA